MIFLDLFFLKVAIRTTNGLKYIFGKSGHSILLTWIRTLIRGGNAKTAEK